MKPQQRPPSFAATTRRRSALLRSVAAPAGCLLAVASSGQQPSPTQDASGLFSDFVEVRVINLEVVVTDRAGDLVTGLLPEDFELFVDGRATPIDYFSEVVAGTATRPDGDVQAQPGVTAGSAVPRNFLLYVDDNHTIKRQRDAIVRGLIADLDFLGPADRMAIVAQSGTRLHMLSTWSDDRRNLTRALGRLLDASEFGGSLTSPLWTARRAALAGSAGLADVRGDAPGDRTFLLDDFSLAQRPEALPTAGRIGAGTAGTTFTDLPSTSADAGFELRESLIDLEFAITGAIATMRGFAAPEGRKVMMLLGGDWPIGPFESGDGAVTPLSAPEVIAPLVETANLLGYSLYPISVGSAESIWRNASDTRIAARTGGRPLWARTDVLAQVVLDTETYYWLGFVPQMTGNNIAHRLDVRLKQRGMVVRSRDSYLDLSRNGQLAMMAQGALLFGSADEDSALKVDFGRATRWGLRKMDVPVVVEIPLAKLTSVVIQGEDLIEMELRFVAVDENGASSRVPAIPITLRGQHDPGEVYRFETTFHLRRRPHELLVSVYDRLAGKAINAKAEVSFRSTQEDGSD